MDVLNFECFLIFEHLLVCRIDGTSIDITPILVCNCPYFLPITIITSPNTKFTSHINYLHNFCYLWYSGWLAICYFENSSCSANYYTVVALLGLVALLCHQGLINMVFPLWLSLQLEISAMADWKRCLYKTSIEFLYCGIFAQHLLAYDSFYWWLPQFLLQETFI